MPSFKIPEVWKPLPGYTGKYRVSNHGRVLSMAWKLRPYDKILNGQIDTRYGYVYVDLWKNSKAIRRYIHSLVLLAFRGLKRGRDSRHLNDVKTDNYLPNLKYGTRSENLYDSYKNNPALRKKLSVSQRRRRRREHALRNS